MATAARTAAPAQAAMDWAPEQLSIDPSFRASLENSFSLANPRPTRSVDRKRSFQLADHLVQPELDTGLVSAGQPGYSNTADDIVPYLDR
jgi:hypothetical protein